MTFGSGSHLVLRLFAQTLLEALDALREVAHQTGNLSGPEQQYEHQRRLEYATSSGPLIILQPYAQFGASAPLERPTRLAAP